MHVKEKPCKECGNIHHGVLHYITQEGLDIVLLTTSQDQAYLTTISF